jgi:hypothetical protein
MIFCKSLGERNNFNNKLAGSKKLQLPVILNQKTAKVICGSRAPEWQPGTLNPIISIGLKQSSYAIKVWAFQPLLQLGEVHTVLL